MMFAGTKLLLALHAANPQQRALVSLDWQCGRALHRTGFTYYGNIHSALLRHPRMGSGCDVTTVAATATACTLAFGHSCVTDVKEFVQHARNAERRLNSSGSLADVSVAIFLNKVLCARKWLYS